ncbi:methyltransferase [bacterium]|nr:methyltransferase [bacterium]
MFKKINIDSFTINQEGLENKINEDCLWLCSFIEGELNQKKVLELGSGSGLISIFIQKNFKVKEITSIEIEDKAFKSLNENIKTNNCSNIKAYKYDIRNLKDSFKPNSYDLIITNPPFFKVGHGKQSINTQRLLARHEILCNMTDIFDVSYSLLKSKGSFIFCYPQTRDNEVSLNAENFKFNIAEKKSKKNINFYCLIKD